MGNRPSAPSARSAETNDYNDLQADGFEARAAHGRPPEHTNRRTTPPADTSTVRHASERPPTVRLNPLTNKAADAADGLDGQPPPISGGQTRI